MHATFFLIIFRALFILCFCQHERNRKLNLSSRMCKYELQKNVDLAVQMLYFVCNRNQCKTSTVKAKHKSDYLNIESGRNTKYNNVGRFDCGEKENMKYEDYHNFSPSLFKISEKISRLSVLVFLFSSLHVNTSSS